MQAYGPAFAGDTGADWPFADTADAVWSTADLFDEHEDDVEVCDVVFLRFGQRRKFRGKCETVRTHADHRIVADVLGQAGDGRVLVIDAGGDGRVAVMGDRLARIGSANGWAGVVINGAIRDSEHVDHMDLGVRALAVTARRSVHAARGRAGVEVQFGGVTFRSGYWVYADADAVLCSADRLD